MFKKSFTEDDIKELVNECLEETIKKQADEIAELRRMVKHQSGEIYELRKRFMKKVQALTLALQKKSLPNFQRRSHRKFSLNLRKKHSSVQSHLLTKTAR